MEEKFVFNFNRRFRTAGTTLPSDAVKTLVDAEFAATFSTSATAGPVTAAYCNDGTEETAWPPLA